MNAAVGPPGILTASSPLPPCRDGQPGPVAVALSSMPPQRIIVHRIRPPLTSSPGTTRHTGSTAARIQTHVGLAIRVLQTTDHQHLGPMPDLMSHQDLQDTVQTHLHPPRTGIGFL